MINLVLGLGSFRGSELGVAVGQLLLPEFRPMLAAAPPPELGLLGRDADGVPLRTVVAGRGVPGRGRDADAAVPRRGRDADAAVPRLRGPLWILWSWFVWTTESDTAEIPGDRGDRGDATERDTAVRGVLPSEFVAVGRGAGEWAVAVFGEAVLSTGSDASLLGVLPWLESRTLR